MFGKHRRLLRDGTQAEAVVLDVRTHGGHIGSAGTSPIWHELQLRVHYPDGTTADTAARLGSDFHSASASPSVGDIIPIRFDPEKPATVLVDEPALVARRDEQRQALAEAAIERAERRLAGLPDIDTTQPPPSDDQMQTAYQAWKAAAAKTKESKAAHKTAEAAGTATKGELLRLFNQSMKRSAEEKSAREKYNALRKRRPDWTSTDRPSPLPSPHD